MQAELPNGRNLLHIAAIKGSVYDISWYLHHRININSRSRGRGYTPLHFAAEYGHTAAVRRLLEEPRIDITARTRAGGETALHLAAKRGHLGVVQLLLACSRVIIDMRDKLGRTALIEAALNNEVYVVSKLLQKHANAWTPDNGGHAAIHRAAIAGSATAVRHLYHYDSRLIQQRTETSAGWTPLHLAARSDKCSEVVKYLVDHGAKRSARIERGDLAGRTPADIARRYGCVRNWGLLTYL